MSFLVGLQGACVILLAVISFYVFEHQKTRLHSYLFLYCITTLVNCTGYLLELLSETPDASLLAVKMAYLGKLFIPVSLFIFVMNTCSIKIPKFVYKLMFLFHAFLYTLVLTCDSNTLFYSSISYSTEGLFPHVVLSHGPFFWVYLGLLLIYFAMGFFFLFKALKTEIQRERKRVLLYIFVCVFAEFIALLFYMLQLTKGYDSTSIGYTLAAILMFIAIFKHDMLGNIDLVKDHLLDNLKDGVIACNPTDDIFYYNAIAESLFPQISSRPFEVMEIIRDSISSPDYLSLNGKIYSIETTPLEKNNVRQGTVFNLRDITARYRYTMKLQEENEFDQMTGLYNRKSYDCDIDALDLSVDYVTLISFDLNGLKRANDTHGHAAGDELIIGAAKCIQTVFSRFGKCYRIGGDEFAAIIMAKSLDESVRMEFKKVISEWKGNLNDEMSISYGVASSFFYSGITINDLIIAADKLMYADKNNYYLANRLDRRKY